jgi:hypothetical protein
MLANTLRFQPTADNAQHLHNSEAESEPTTQTQQSKEQERRNAPYMLVKQGSESDRSTEGSRINGQIQNVQKQPQQLPHELPHEQDEKEALPDDMRRYIRDCEQGRFYDSLMEQMNVPPEDRNQFKRDVFREIYFGTSWEDTPLRRAYIARYPHVWELIRKQKKGNYRALAWEMQRAESRLMIDTVVHRFYLEYPHIPIITVHDSILTTPQHVETVKRIMVEEFARLGLHPTIKTTSYARKELDVLQAA